MNKRLAIEVPDLTTLPTLTDVLDRVRVSEANPDPRCRIRYDGEVRFNVSGVTRVCSLGKLHNAGPQYGWMAVKQGQLTGSLYLVPTDENDPDRIAVNWYEAGHDVAFSLNKVLKLKKIHIPPDHALACPCRLVNIKDFGAALELRLSDATPHPLEHAAPDPAPNPAVVAAVGEAIKAAAAAQSPDARPGRKSGRKRRRH